MATLVTDNLNSYSNGDIIGQGNWTDSSSGTAIFTIEGTVVYEGAKAVKGSPTILSSARIKNAASDTADGSQVGYMRVSSVTTNYQSLMQVKDSGGNTLFQIGINAVVAGKDEIILGYSDGTVLASLATGISANTFYALELNWRSSDHKVRGRVNGGAFSSFFAYQDAFTTAPNTLLLQVNTDGINLFDTYFDTFAETQYNLATAYTRLALLGVG